MFWFRAERRHLATGLDGEQLPWTAENLGQHISSTAALVRAARRNLATAHKAEAGYIVNHLVPDAEKKRMLLVRCGVMLVPARVVESPAMVAMIAAYIRAGAECGVLPPSRESLYTAFTRAMLYSRLNMYGAANWAAAALNRAPANGFRLASTYGAMRGSGDTQ